MKTIYTVVFKEKPGGGNPCPVILDADGLTGEEMRKKAEQYGMEAAFVSAADRQDCRWRVRYFTPDHELSSCVHATIAAVSVLLKEGRLSGDHALLESAAGETNPVSWRSEAGRFVVSADQGLPAVKTIDPALEGKIAEVLGLPAGELLPEAPEAVSTSRPKLMVGVKSVSVLDGIRPQYEALWELCDEIGVSGFYPYALTERDGETVVRARQFPNRSGYPEDPATGVAAASLLCYLFLTGQVNFPKSGWSRMMIFQGQAMGRPSVLEAELLLGDGDILQTRVSGSAEITEELAPALNETKRS